MLSFGYGVLGGRAKVNRYFGPFTLGEARALSVGVIDKRSMAPIYEREDLREHEYFLFLERVSRWDIQNGNLKLFSSAENGSEVVLVFFEFVHTPAMTGR